MKSKTLKANTSSAVYDDLQVPLFEDESIKFQHSKDPLWDYMADISLELKELKPNLADQKKKIKTLEDRIRTTEDRIRTTEKDLTKASSKNTETLGIFVALFTFISTEFQVFRIYQSPQSVSGLTLIILGSLLMFVCFLDYVLNTDSFFENGYSSGKFNKNIFSWSKVKIFPILMLSMVLLACGVMLFVTDNGRLKVKEEAITRGYSLSTE